MESLDKHFRKLTEPAFRKYGFAYGELLAQWPAIVGERLAAVSTPERIRWPRGFDNAREGERLGGTLLVKVSGGSAIELQHDAPRIIERINGFYGYEAIASLKIKQSQLRSKKPADAMPAPPEDSQTPAEIAQKLQDISDDRLRETLSRLGTGVFARAAATRQRR